ncbi:MULTISPECIES: hypothetical protein [unclassified Cupriavidus]|uniref:hypothetical protein n=1 Tax=unclassified Cupriavidus TaxID=2640874 RepID=UPI00313A8611
MKYADGQDVKVGDMVGLGEDRGGVVVCDIDAGDYTPNDAESAWGYLKKGVMVVFPSYGHMYYESEMEEDVFLIARKQD